MHFIASVVFLLVSQIPLSDTARLEFDRIGLFCLRTVTRRLLPKFSLWWSTRKNEWTQSVKSYPLLYSVLYWTVLDCTYCAVVESICPRLGVWMDLSRFVMGKQQQQQDDDDGFSSSPSQEQNLAGARLTTASSTAGGTTTNHEDDKSIEMLKEQEDRERVEIWLAHGKINSKRMAEMLPTTVQDLMDGKTNIKDVMRTLESMLAQRVFLGLLIRQLSQRTIPEHWCRNEEQKRWFNQAQLEFQGDLMKCFDFVAISVFENNIQLSLTKSSQKLQEVFQETCTNWAQRVDQALFRGKKNPTFLFLCPTNKLSQSEFKDLIEDLFKDVCDEQIFPEEYEQIRLRMYQLQYAIHLFGVGAHDVFSSCWECRGVLGDVRFDRCASCNVARYCGRECQLRAWKSGHKKCCASLKKRSNQFLESHKEINRFHETGGSTVEGFELQILTDYFIAARLVRSPCVYPVITTEDGMELGLPRGPSMVYFYENLARVLRREWWVYPTTISLEKYTEKSKDNSSREDEFFLEYLCFFLSHDIFGFVAERSKESGIEEGTVMDLLLKKSPVAGIECDGMPMERFMELYHSMAPQFGDGIAYKLDPKQYRKNMKAHTYNGFRETLHK